MQNVILANSLFPHGDRNIEAMWNPCAALPRLSAADPAIWLRPGASAENAAYANAVTIPSVLDPDPKSILLPSGEYQASLLPVRLRLPSMKWDMNGFGVYSFGELQHVILNASPRADALTAWTLGEEVAVLAEGDRPKRILDACARERIISEASSLSLKVSTRPTGASQDSRASAGNVAVFKMFFSAVLDTVANMEHGPNMSSQFRLILTMAPVDLLYWGSILNTLIKESKEKRKGNISFGFGATVTDHAFVKSQAFTTLSKGATFLTKGKMRLNSAMKADEIDSYIGGD